MADIIMDEQSIGDDRNRVKTPALRFSEAWDALTREFDLQELNLNPDELFVRQPDAGRTVDLSRR